MIKRFLFYPALSASLEKLEIKESLLTTLPTGLFPPYLITLPDVFFTTFGFGKLEGTFFCFDPIRGAW